MISSSLLQSVADYAKANINDGVLETLCSAAVEKCELETGKAFDERSGLYSLAIKMLATEWYDHRGQTTTENLKEMPLATNLQSILNQIAMSTEFREVEKK